MSDQRIVRLSIVGSACTHCGAIMEESLICPGCGWADPLAKTPERTDEKLADRCEAFADMLRDTEKQFTRVEKGILEETFREAARRLSPPLGAPGKRRLK